MKFPGWDLESRAGRLDAVTQQALPKFVASFWSPAAFLCTARTRGIVELALRRKRCAGQSELSDQAGDRVPPRCPLSTDDVQRTDASCAVDWIALPAGTGHTADIMVAAAGFPAVVNSRGRSDAS